MLKRIKVRGKLLLLLATPLVAVAVFAYSGIVDRTEHTSFQEGEARIAELADAGADLSLSIQVERIRVLEADRMLIDAEQLAAERAETDAQLRRWVAAARNASGDLSDPRLVSELDDLAERLPATLAPDRGTDTVTGTLLAGASRAIDDVTTALAGQASDLDLFRALSELNELTQIQSSYATIASVGSEAIAQDSLSAVAATLVTDAERTAENSLDAFSATANSDYLISLERLKNSGVLPKSTTGGDTIAEIQSYIADVDNGGVVAWLQRGEEQLRGLNAIIGTLLFDATASAQQEATAANEEVQSFLLLAGGVILLALLMALFIGRSISRPLTQLTRSAEQLSAEELPALVESMRSAGRAEAPVLTPIEAKGRDEVAQLAHAISEIQQVTIDVAEEQTELLRRGISDIFVNLARRNQSLLDRQIDFIDQLESKEENPDQLENLFRLDHLATRMRRNAESLLVLAGAEPTRRRGRPVEIADVLRVAMGEIEDFSRIELMAVDPSTVAGSVAVDLAHLMSELMENATQFSPPEVPVEVVGYRIADDSYQLTLTDRGIGMSAEQIATANKTLSEPPLVGLDLSRSLGFTVVSRLAHRLGVVVQLTAGSDGGVTAVVTIPSEMVGYVDLNDPTESVESPSDALDAIEALAAPADDAPANSIAIADHLEEPLPSREATGDPSGETAPVFHEDSVRPTEAETPPEPIATDAATEGLAKLPTRKPKTPAADEPAADSNGDIFSAFGTEPGNPPAPSDPEADLFAPIDSVIDLPTRIPKAAPTEAGTAVDTPSELPIDDAPEALPSRDPAAVGAVSSQVTGAGLIRRTPKQVDVPEESMYSPGATPSQPEPAAAPAASRSPEEVRQMLSRYRAGLRKGRGPDSDPDQPNRQS